VYENKHALMKRNLIILFLLVSIVWAYKSCYYRFDCDYSDSVKLGKTDYSTEFKKYNIEINKDTINFRGSTDDLILIRKSNLNKKPRRVNDYKICRKIDMYPIDVYAYYEYENLNSVFRSDSAVLAISPDINNVGNKRGESLFLSFSIEKFGELKGRVPISNIDTTITYTPYNELFEYHKSIELEGELFKNIWVFRKGKSAFYYSKNLGIIALEGKGKFYIRKYN